MNSNSFIKQCISEVLLEAKKRSVPAQKDKIKEFLNECISEVIIEPHQSLTVHGNPKRLLTAHLIKECVMEVLKENLTEGFDPMSDAGPNPVQENPYPEWNNKMRKMEEDKGTVAHGRYAQEAGATPLMSTFTEIRNKYDPDGTKHDLTLKCVKCGTTHTCRCSKPKRTMEGICDECAKKQSLKENTSTIQWQCPHCNKVTKILLEIESPSDYISCSECEHCGTNINEMALDMKIYEAVIRHFDHH